MFNPIRLSRRVFENLRKCEDVIPNEVPYPLDLIFVNVRSSAVVTLGLGSRRLECSFGRQACKNLSNWTFPSGIEVEMVQRVKAIDLFFTRWSVDNVILFVVRNGPDGLVRRF